MYIIKDLKNEVELTVYGDECKQCTCIPTINNNTNLPNDCYIVDKKESVYIRD